MRVVDPARKKVCSRVTSCFLIAYCNKKCNFKQEIESAIKTLKKIQLDVIFKLVIYLIWTYWQITQVQVPTEIASDQTNPDLWIDIWLDYRALKTLYAP